jgi:hypothetical protein
MSTDSNKLFNYLWIFILITSQSFASREIEIVSNGGIVEWVTETSYKRDPETGNPQIDSLGRADLGYSIAKTFRGTETFYLIGEYVTLKPTADDGYQFTYWLVDGLANESTGVIYSGSPGSFISAGAYDGITFDLNNSIVGKVEAFFSEIPDPQKVDTNSSSYKEGFSDGVISVQNDPNSYELISKQDYDNKMSQFPSLTLDASPYTLDWYYQPNRGWMWTKKSCFPYIFDQNSSNWLFFEDANENPRFYEYESKSWILLK